MICAKKEIPINGSKPKLLSLRESNAAAQQAAITVGIQAATASAAILLVRFSFVTDSTSFHMVHVFFVIHFSEQYCFTSNPAKYKNDDAFILFLSQ